MKSLWKCWLCLVLLVLSARRTDSVCGDALPDEGEECDFGDVIPNDGCSDTCRIEKISVQTWYLFPNCSGPILKTVIHNIREYAQPIGACASGLPCRCPYEVPICDDGSEPICLCGAPSCRDDFGTCQVWNDTRTPQAHSFETSCYNEFPTIPTSNRHSISGAFIINKGWRLTDSSSLDGSVLADTRAWELTRRRGLGIGQPDYWHVYAADRCIPSWNSLAPEDKIKPMYTYEIHNQFNQRSKVNCSDPQCTHCTHELPTSQVICNHSLTCQVLSPGRCFACTGALANKFIPGFKAFPGPPSPDPLTCQPCSNAPDNYFYGDSACTAGEGCGDCVPGMSCGMCGEKDAPPTSCGDPRMGGLPFYWLNSVEAEEVEMREASKDGETPVVKPVHLHGFITDKSEAEALKQASNLRDLGEHLAQRKKGKMHETPSATTPKGA